MKPSFSTSAGLPGPAPYPFMGLAEIPGIKGIMMAEACPVCGMKLPGTGPLGGSELQVLQRIEHLLQHLVSQQTTGQARP